MRQVDMSCDGVRDENGVCTLTLTAKGLTMKEAIELGELVREPFREAVKIVLDKDGAKLLHRDMMEKLQ